MRAASRDCSRAVRRLHVSTPFQQAELRKMNSEEIAAMQQRIKDRFDPSLKVDGIWGRISRDTCRRYLRSLMPNPNPWPKGDQASLRRFYGVPGDEGNLVRIQLPYPIYYGGKRVTSTRVHHRCAASLLRILVAIRDLLPKHPHIVDDAEDFGGVFNDRNRRGSATKSVHAWGAAIDLDADDNTFRNIWPQEADMPLEIMECFAREGWASAGAFWGYDAMHHEAVQQ